MAYRRAIKAGTNAVTNNGMPTNITSGSPTVDLFFMIGSSRGKDIRAEFDAAYAHDRITTLRMLLHARDVRGGAGERDTSRSLLKHLALTRTEEAEKLIPHLAAFGRWDDLLIFDGPLQDAAFSVIAEGLADPKVQALTAKWMPRYPSTSPSSRRKVEKTTRAVIGKRERGPLSAHRVAQTAKAEALRRFLRLSERDYRRTLVNLSRTVEQAMSASRWDAIQFGKLPSLAAARYQKAFNRHCAEAYAAYKEKLKAGTEKVNATAIHPHEVIRTFKTGDLTVAAGQWDSLPNYLGADSILPLIDVSSSMERAIGAGGLLQCIDVAVALGLYVADKQQGPFAGCWLNFSDRPKMRVLTGDIIQKYNSVRSDSDWGGSTDVEAAFEEILRVAKDHKIAPADMPKMLLVLSDMEFNPSRQNGANTAFQMVRDQFAKSGYDLPRLVWWNLNARPGNNPVTARQADTAMVSGFSPAIMRAVLKAQDFTPEGIMRAALDQPRYADVVF